MPYLKGKNIKKSTPKNACLWLQGFHEVLKLSPWAHRGQLGFYSQRWDSLPACCDLTLPGKSNIVQEIPKLQDPLDLEVPQPIQLLFYFQGWTCWFIYPWGPWGLHGSAFCGVHVRHPSYVGWPLRETDTVVSIFPSYTQHIFID